MRIRAQRVSRLSRNPSLRALRAASADQTAWPALRARLRSWHSGLTDGVAGLFIAGARARPSYPLTSAEGTR